MVRMASPAHHGGCCGPIASAAALPAFLLSAPPAPKPAPVPVQRARLWDLNATVHCSIIGTCLTTAELRRVMGKVVQADIAGFSDHDLHAQAVGLCVHRNPASKLLQKALDQRHETVIRRLARLRGQAAVMAAWTEYRRAGDIPGAYWAVLTHPDVGPDGVRRAFGDVHMLSHLVGAANRADIRRLTALEEETGALRAKLERQQARFHETVAARDDTIRQLGRLAAGQIVSEAAASDDDALAGLRHVVSELQSRLDRETARRESLDQRLTAAADSARQCEARAAAAEAALAAAEREVAALECHEDAESGPAPLPAQRVLYVGGRPGAIAQMRALLDQAGGALLVHDGGRHDQPSLLPGLIGQADLVVFPVDCVSHDAALTVKRLCRQQSKPWAPLRSAGLGAFMATLAHPDTNREVAP